MRQEIQKNIKSEKSKLKQQVTNRGSHLIKSTITRYKQNTIACIVSCITKSILSLTNTTTQPERVKKEQTRGRKRRRQRNRLDGGRESGNLTGEDPRTPKLPGGEKLNQTRPNQNGGADRDEPDLYARLRSCRRRKLIIAAPRLTRIRSSFHLPPTIVFAAAAS